MSLKQKSFNMGSDSNPYALGDHVSPRTVQVAVSELRIFQIYPWGVLTKMKDIS